MKLLSALALSHIIVLVVLLFRDGTSLVYVSSNSGPLQGGWQALRSRPLTDFHNSTFQVTPYILPHSDISTESHEESHPNISNDITCAPPLHLVGNYCLVIEHEKTGLQSQMQSFCEDLGGTLVSIKDANMLHDIIAILRDHGMDDVSYWIGAEFNTNRWEWRWTSDYSRIRSGPPLWGNIRRNGGTEHRCLIIKASDFYYIDVVNCNNGTYGGICQPKDVSPEPMPVAPADDCPFPYKVFGNYSGCYQVHLLMEHTWYEAVKLCQGNNTHLAKIDDANLISAIYDQLLHEDAALWVGGKEINDFDDWAFLDHSPVKRGTPFWVVINEKQEPGKGNCLALTSENEYHFDDFSCYENFGALCEYDL